MGATQQAVADRLLALATKGEEMLGTHLCGLGLDDVEDGVEVVERRRRGQ